jgi:hypothetical protein
MAKYILNFLFLFILSATLANDATATGITITTSSLPAATQYQTNYSAPALTASGGTPPYSWSVTSAGASLPEGMSLDPATGIISSSGQVGGQGGYYFQVQATDSQGLTGTAFLTLNVAADNTFGGCNIFPPDSIFHHRVDALPVDNSPAAPIPAAYVTHTIQPAFGAMARTTGPDGIPFIRVPYNQPMINIQWLLYGDVSDPATSSTTNPLTDTIPHYPFPPNAPIEGTVNAVAEDQHVMVLQTAGGGKPCQLYEVWQGVQANTTVSGTFFNWTASNGAHWDLSSDALRPLWWTSADAAGLPIMPLTVNYDETCPGGQASSKSPCTGIVGHPIRFTLDHMLNAAVWPARSTSGLGYCTNANGTNSNQTLLVSQSKPPVSCTNTAPAGEIYRLKKSVTVNGQTVAPSSLCPASTNPQAAAIITAMQNYGIILADNGDSGDIIGTPDARWNDNDLSCLKNLTLANFEPVNVSSLQVNPDSGATGGLSITLKAVNTAQGTIVLTATTVDTTGTVTNVTFNNVSSGNSPLTGSQQNTPPTYTMTLTNQPDGATETFTATATDSNNASATSSQASVTLPGAVLVNPNIITTSVGLHGTMSPMNPAVPYQGNQTFTFTPDTGYKVYQVFLDGSQVSIVGNTYTLNNVTAPHTLKASFSKMTCLITTTPTVNGSIRPVNPNITYGNSKTFRLSPASGYQVNQVLVDGTAVNVSNNAFTLNNITACHTITATFSPAIAGAQQVRHH